MGAQVNQNGYTLLLAFATEAAKVIGLEAKAKAKLDSVKEAKQGTYDKAILAGIACGTADSFEATMDSFMDNIRQNRGGLATKLRAEKREEVGRRGETHKIPSSVSTAKTVILFALRNGVPLELGGKPRPYGDVRDENQATRDLAEEAKEKARMEAATGVERALYDAQAAVMDLQTALASMSEAWLLEVIAQSREAIRASAEENAKAQAAIEAAAKRVAKGVEGSGDELADALSKRVAKQKKAA